MLCKYKSDRQTDTASSCVRDMYSVTGHRIRLSEEVAPLRLGDPLLTDEEDVLQREGCAEVTGRQRGDPGLLVSCSFFSITTHQL